MVFASKIEALLTRIQMSGGSKTVKVYTITPWHLHTSISVVANTATKPFNRSMLPAVYTTTVSIYSRERLVSVKNNYY